MSQDMPPLYQAILLQDHAFILAQSGPSLREPWMDMPPLSFAASAWRDDDTEEQKIEVVRSLLKAGAPVDLTSGVGATALDDAVMGGHKKLASFLRSQGVQALLTLGSEGLSNQEMDEITAQLKNASTAPTVPRTLRPAAPGGGSPLHSPSFPGGRPARSAGPAILVFALSLGMVGWGAAKVWTAGGASPSATPAAATATAAPAVGKVGQRYLADAQTALVEKRYLDAGIRGDLAVDVLSREHGFPKDKIAAHKVAGQAYYRLKEYSKALPHYKALKALDPANQHYPALVAEIAALVPAPAPVPPEHHPSEAFWREREEHRLDSEIVVGREHMTVREYERRTQPRAPRTPPPKLNY